MNDSESRERKKDKKKMYEEIQSKLEDTLNLNLKMLEEELDRLGANDTAKREGVPETATMKNVQYMQDLKDVKELKDLSVVDETPIK